MNKWVLLGGAWLMVLLGFVTHEPCVFSTGLLLTIMFAAIVTENYLDRKE